MIRHPAVETKLPSPSGFLGTGDRSKDGRGPTLPLPLLAAMAVAGAKLKERRPSAAVGDAGRARCAAMDEIRAVVACKLGVRSIDDDVRAPWTDCVCRSLSVLRIL